MRMLCIDPGTPFGWALWEGAKLRRWGVEKSNARSWHQRSHECAVQLKYVILHTLPQRVYCEMPIYMSGHAAAAGGNLVKLCCTVGRFMEVCDGLGMPFFPVAVADWLGQLPEEAVRHRVRQIMGPKIDEIPSHALDGVAMGLHVLGKWPKG